VAPGVDEDAPEPRASHAHSGAVTSRDPWCAVSGRPARGEDHDEDRCRRHEGRSHEGGQARHAPARSPCVGAPRWHSQLEPAPRCTFSDAVKTWVPVTLGACAVFVRPEPEGF
jgi:hypothetical protein